MEAEQLKNALSKAEERITELSQQLQESDRELEMLSYSVSHDLRAPLRAIKGFSEALIEDYAGKMDDEGKRFLDIISTSTNRVVALLDAILVYSRTGRQEVRPDRVDMDQVVRGMVVEVQSKSAGRQIKFTIGKLPDATGDLALLRQLWSELLANAVKFTTPRQTASIEVTGKAGPKEHVYSIKDNGVGFDLKYADKLFGVFQRFHTEKEFPGVGIGLAVAQRIVRRHGGRIWAESAVNNGSTFHFSLPVSRSS